MRVKKFLSILLSLVMTFSMLSVSVYATDGEQTEDNGIFDTISEGIASATDYLQTELIALHEDTGVTYGYEWHIISLLRGGKLIDEEILSEYYESVVSTVDTWDYEIKPTDISRVALALTLMDKDITDVGGVNLPELIFNNTRLSDGSNEFAYSLLALDASGEENPEEVQWSREEMVSSLLAYQAEDGGFGLYDASESDVDITAICMQALKPYSEDEVVKSAVENGIEFLQGAISQEYNYADNTNTTAQVLLTLATMGIDVTDNETRFGNGESNIITGLETYRNPDGSGYIFGNNVNPMATVQVLMAYDGYRKAHKEDILYWDFATEGDIYDDTFQGDAEEPDTEAAEPAVVYVTIATGGNVADAKDGGYVAQAPVTVMDIDENGTLTVDEALYAAHETYYEGGVATGYASYNSAYGLSLATLWGVGDIATPATAGYYLNNASCFSLADEVEVGDYICAFNYYDAVGWSDAYSYFVNNTEEVSTGNSVTLELKYQSGYDMENNWAPVFSPCSDADVVILGGNNSVQKNLKTDSDGKVKIKFSSSADEGDYYVMASKEDGSIVPAICKITVTDDNAGGGAGGSVTRNITAYIRVADPEGETYFPRKSYLLEQGTTAYELLRKTGLDIQATNNSYGTYIKSVEGLAEFDEGPESGWMFRVNGKFPSYSISSYILSNRDYVELLYTRDLGEDIGDTYVRVSSGGGSVTTSYTVEFDTNEGNAVAAQKISKNDVVTKPADPEKEGYTFEGWYEDKAFEVLYDFSEKVTKDLTLYAKWKEAEKKTEELLHFDENTFDDVKKDDWYYDAVKFAYERQLLMGNDQNFDPESKMTRAMVATILWRMADEPVVNYLLLFDDVNEEEWYTEAIRWAASEKITSGTSADTFGTNDTISREQLITMLYRYIQKKYPEYSVDTSENELDAYADAKAVSPYAVDAMNWAIGSKIINGKSDSKLCPTEALSRCEMATILMRLCVVIEK